MPTVQRRHAGGYELIKPVFLVGFMGAGKTSVAQYLAGTLSLPSIDADSYLELLEDRIIADIFAEDGEDYFRDLETEYLEDLAKRSPRFISCGGGVIKRPENLKLMRRFGYVVYLKVTAEAAAERIPHTESRPLFKNLDTARVSLAEREPLYERAADVHVVTTGRSIPEISEEIKTLLLEADILVKED